MNETCRIKPLVELENVITASMPVQVRVEGQ